MDGPWPTPKETAVARRTRKDAEEPVEVPEPQQEVEETPQEPEREPEPEPEPQPDVVQVYLDDAGQYRWRRVAGNGRRLAASGEAFYDKHSAVRAAYRANPDTIADGATVKVQIEDEDDSQ